MRILYLHQFFTTRAGVGGTRSYEFARRFAAAGHEVVMVTAAREADPPRRECDGIQVVAVRGGYADYVAGTAVSYPRRMVEFARFTAASAVAAMRAPRPDVVYATSPPLTVALAALAARARHRAPVVFEVRDLWPEAPIQMGALRNPLLRAGARMLERLAYRAAARVIALSPGIREGVLAAGAPPAKVEVIPNAADLDLFSPELDGAGERRRLGLAGKFVCSYFGTMGEANDLGQVVEAAKLLARRGEDGVTFVLLGQGKQRGELEQRAHGLHNVVFVDPIADKGSVARLAAASDACLTVFKDVPVLATCSPNKLFDTFAAGRPAIVNTEGWQRELVERHDAGVYAAGPEGIAEQTLWLRDHPDEVRRRGANARRLAEREFDRDALAARALAVLERAAAER
jgi:glycosyltransferase involved in cell wall biosynthesis